MPKEEPTRPRVPVQRSDEPPTQEGVSSFAVWANTTMLGQDDDADQFGNDAFLRGID
jgi:hypothetical protein